MPIKPQINVPIAAGQARTRIGAIRSAFIATTATRKQAKLQGKLIAMADDPLIRELLAIRADLPSPRPNLSEDAKDLLIQNLGGPHTVRNLLKAKASLPASRLPFLFNRLDTQAVLDVLANDMTAALARAEAVAKVRKTV